MTAPANPEEVVTVANFSDPAAAQLALGVLESSGIQAFLSGEEANSLIPPALGARLQVQQKDLETAKSLLTDLTGGEALGDDGNDL